MKYPDRWESDGPPATYEVMRSPDFAVPRSKKTKPQSQTRKWEPKISMVRRPIGLQDAQKIDLLAQVALEESGQTPIRQKQPEDYGVSLLPPRMSRKIYLTHFHNRNKPRQTLARFNNLIDEFLKDDADRATPTRAYLGEIIVLETVNPYVAAKVYGGEPMGNTEMKAQQTRLLDFLTGDKSTRRHVMGEVNNPHVSFGQFNDSLSANAFKDELAKQEFSMPVLIAPPIPVDAPIALYSRQYRV